MEAPKELPKVSLVNESLKKLKFHRAKFDNVVKIRTTPDARTEGEWGFEHTKAVFNNEIIPFLKSLKGIFNVFDNDLLNEIMEVQTVFNQMDTAVQQSSVDKQCLEISKKKLILENDRLLQQIMSQDVLLTVMNSMSLNGESMNTKRKRNESCDKCFNLDVELLKTKNAHNALLKSYSQLEKHCISLELSIQLNQEIFQKDESCDNQNVFEIPEYFENNDLKAQLQDKDTTICKLKEIIKSIREKSTEENVNYDYCEIETKNVELENSVAKLLSENELLCKEINHVKQFGISGLLHQVITAIADKIQDNVFLILASSPTTVSEVKRVMLCLDFKICAKDKNFSSIWTYTTMMLLRVRNHHGGNVYIRYLVDFDVTSKDTEDPSWSTSFKSMKTQKTSSALEDFICVVFVPDRNIVKAKQPLDNALAFARFKCSTSNCGSKPTSNNKKDRISQTPSRNMKNKVAAQPRKVNKKNRMVEPIHDVDVKHALLNANSICATCKKSMFDDVHDMCLLDFVENVNSRAKFAKKHKKQNIWKPTGHVFTKVGLKWKPTGRTFTIVDNSCPLTRITSANIGPPKKTTSYSVET
ncbi:hypothetical protein Tco_1328717 [Tanacetum coccineum]